MPHEGNMPMMEFKGLAINSGRAVAPACLYSSNLHKSVDEYSIEETEIESELIRFERALIESSKDLEIISSRVAGGMGVVESEIFLAQNHIMNDAAIVRQIKDLIRNTRKNVESVIFEVYRNYEEKFRSMDSPYLRERVSDISEIRRRLLDNLKKQKPGFLCEGQQHCQRGAGRVIVAEEFTADMMAHMNFERVRGFATEHGGVSSHAAIIARSLGIPAVTGLKNITEFAKCGQKVLVDGDAGTVYLEPEDEVLSRLISVEEVSAEKEIFIITPPGMEVLANASMIDDVKQAKVLRADGIGLYRTEILFIKSDRLLSEDEQFRHYSSVVEEMGDKTVTFRLLDVGGDKPLPFLRIQKESNPYLGWRGARFLLGNPDIFLSQIRALLRLSKKNKIRIMIPMVVDERQYAQVTAAIRDAGTAVGMVAENISLGAMFEVPSACIQAKKILKLADFGSIGSNDLIQYLFAVDRNNEQVSADYNPEHPILWEMLMAIVDAAAQEKKHLSICGEMAGREGMARRLLDIGIHSLSVSPRLIPQVRNEMANHFGAKHLHSETVKTGRSQSKARVKV
jgi:phosphotransferase system enzyme I (PtsI)